MIKIIWKFLTSHVWGFLKDAITFVIKNTDLSDWDNALIIVANLAKSTFENKAKQQIAFQALTDFFIKKKKELPTHIVNFMIESILNSFKNGKKPNSQAFEIIVKELNLEGHTFSLPLLKLKLEAAGIKLASAEIDKLKDLAISYIKAINENKQ